MQSFDSEGLDRFGASHDTPLRKDFAVISRAQKSAAIADYCRKLVTSGLTHGTSGNISVRHDDGFLISPTSLPYDQMRAEDIVFVAMNGSSNDALAPSSEWRFHLDIFANRPECQAVVHAHPNYCTALAILGRAIPPVHYMVAVFGGRDVRCADYAIYGSQELSDHAVAALANRHACLLAHHGMISIGTSIEQAFWRATELETLARQYHASLQISDTPPELTDAQMDEVLAKIAGYGLTSAK